MTRAIQKPKSGFLKEDVIILVLFSCLFLKENLHHYRFLIICGIYP